MRREMKYLIVDVDGLEHVFIFSQYIEHREFAARMEINPIRGGFVYLCDGKLHCKGGAVSLNIQSNEQRDTRLINRNINMDFE